MASNPGARYIKSEEENDISVFLQDNLDNQGGGSLIEEILAEEAETEEANERRSYAISCLENLMHSFLSQLVEAVEDEDAHGRPRGHIELQLADRRAKVQDDGRCGKKTTLFPSRRRHSTNHLACLLAVTNYSHEALVNQVPTTKRDIYYKDPGLFEKQSVVDKIVDDLAATFDLDRSDLGVRASSKGLFAGSGLSIHLRHGGTAMGNDYDSTLIPCDAEISTLEISQDIAFVLIVEKEAVFQTLCRLGFPCHPLLKGPGILITGKGYPDVATRELVNTFSKELPRDVPILAVVDADPHGIEILSVFKFGSAAMDHQRDRLAAPRIQWIGVFSSELQR